MSKPDNSFLDGVLLGVLVGGAFCVIMGLLLTTNKIKADTAQALTMYCEPHDGLDYIHIDKMYAVCKDGVRVWPATQP